MWTTLQHLLADAQIGAASKLAYCWLWHQAGGRPSQIIVHTASLSRALGKSRRAAEKWLDELRKHGLIEIGDRDMRRGTIPVYVFHPNPGERQGTLPNPQMSIDFPATSPAGESALGPKMATPSRQEGLDVLVQEAHDAQKRPGAGLDVSAPKRPSGNEQTRKIPGSASVGLDVSAPKRPSASMNTNDKKSISCQCTKETNDTNGIIGRVSRSEKGPLAAGDLIAAALAGVGQATDIREQKRRLRARIEGIVADPHMHQFVAGAAADLVLLRGVPLADLDHILLDVEAMRAAGRLKSAGAFFHSKARTLAARHGAPWPAKKEVALASD